MIHYDDFDFKHMCLLFCWIPWAIQPHSLFLNRFARKILEMDSTEVIFLNLIKIIQFAEF